MLKSLNQSRSSLSQFRSIWLSDTIALYLLPFDRNFSVAIDSTLCQKLYPSFSTPASKKSVLFHWNLSRHPFLELVVDSVLLFCTGFNLEHAYLFQSLVFFPEKNND